MEVATPEAVARIQGAHFGREADMIWDIYFKEQSHGSLDSFLQSVLIGKNTDGGINVQVSAYFGLTFFKEILIIVPLHKSALKLLF